MLQKFEKWHQTREGLLSFTLIEAGLAYAFASLAINSGSLWQWLLAIMLAIGSIQNFVKFMISFWKKG
jgi:hypothetical protein